MRKAVQEILPDLTAKLKKLLDKKTIDQDQYDQAMLGIGQMQDSFAREEKEAKERAEEHR